MLTRAGRIGKGEGGCAEVEPEECGSVRESDGGMGIGSTETEDGVAVGGSVGETGKVIGLSTEL
jgi:hypothetical protein